MISRKGKTSIEFNNEDNIDIYGKINLSIHAEKANINLKAGLDINMQATKDINMRAGWNFKLLVEGDYDVKVLKNSTTKVE